MDELIEFATELGVNDNHYTNGNDFVNSTRNGSNSSSSSHQTNNSTFVEETQIFHSLNGNNTHDNEALRISNSLRGIRTKRSRKKESITVVDDGVDSNLNGRNHVEKSRTDYRDPVHAQRLQDAINSVVSGLEVEPSGFHKLCHNIGKMHGIPYNTLRDNFLR